MSENYKAPKSQPPGTPISPKGVKECFAEVTGGYITPVVDTGQKYKGSKKLPGYITKCEGYTVLSRIKNELSLAKGLIEWINPNTASTNRTHKLFNIGDKIYITDESGTKFLYDVSEDGYTINSLSGAMQGAYLYICIGDEDMGDNLYRYAGETGIPIGVSRIEDYTSYADGVKIVSPDHGLDVASVFTMSGTFGDYDGLHTVTAKLDDDNIVITPTDGFVLKAENSAFENWTGNTPDDWTQIGGGIQKDEDYPVRRAKFLDTSGVGVGVSQDNVMESGKSYKIAISVVEATDGALEVYNGNTKLFANITTATTHELTFQATSDNIKIQSVGGYCDMVVNDVDISEQYEDATMNTTQQLTVVAMSGMRPAGNIASFGNRLAVTGIGINQASPQYSEFNDYGAFDDFTSGSGEKEGGTFTGKIGGVVNMIEFDEYLAIFEKSKITIHTIKDPLIDAEGLFYKDNNTLLPSLTVSGFGTESRHGAIAARGALYYVDSANGVYEYLIGQTSNGYSKQNTALTDSWRSEFLKYDTSNASIAYDSKRDLLLVSCASIKGGAHDSLLMFSFRTGMWSVDEGKRARVLLASEIDKTVYAVSSTEPELHEIFDGSYTNNGEEITVRAWTRYFDGGRVSLNKEYDLSSVRIGISENTNSFQYEIFSDESAEPGINKTISITPIDSPEAESGMGSWNEYNPGLGAVSSNFSSFAFRQYLEEDGMPDSPRYSVRVTETSPYPFLIFQPEVVVLPTVDYVDNVT